MLIFRYDDYSSAERIKIEIDDTIFRIFRQNKIPLTVAVTPQMVSDVHDSECQSYAELGDDRRRLDLLNSGLAVGWELALHGLTHRRSTVRDNTEFAMTSRRVQMERLAKGREMLLKWFPSVPLRVFVPPWNSYDSVTVEAASANTFEVLCAGPETKATIKSGVSIIPSVMTILDLMTFVRIFSFRRLLADLAGASVVVTLHEYEFRARDQPMAARIKDLQSTMAEIADSRILCGTLSKDSPGNFDISDRSEFQSTLSFVQKLQRPVGRQLTSAMSRLPDGPARDIAERLLRNGISASSRFGRAARKARRHARPLWSSLQRSRAVVAGRFRAGPQYGCPFCGYVGTFSLIGARPNGLCPSCGSLERHRFILATVGPLLRSSHQHRRALMLAPDPLLSMLHSSYRQVVTGDIAARNVDVTFDLQKLPFKDGTFDLILAPHVLDEIEDDRAALRECRRCLSDRGWLVAPVPILARESTIELDERRADGKVRLAGPDYFDRIAAEGFSATDTFEPLDGVFSGLNERQNIRTPHCIAGTEGVVVFEKRGQ